jgi:Rhodopirellula transposase DDE domain
LFSPIFLFYVPLLDLPSSRHARRAGNWIKSSSDASGVGIFYGIYERQNNRGIVCAGISHDTTAFAAHSIATGWKREKARVAGAVFPSF